MKNEMANEDTYLFGFSCVVFMSSARKNHWEGTLISASTVPNFGRRRRL